MRRKGLHCAGCRGHRLHVCRPVADADTGVVSRAWVCSACSRPTPIPAAQQPGITCPKCGDIRMKAVRTEHPRPGMERRRRKCLNAKCGHVIRVKEVVESFAA